MDKRLQGVESKLKLLGCCCRLTGDNTLIFLETKREINRLVIPDGVVRIAKESLEDLKIVEVVVPDTVEYLDGNVFNSNQYLEEITLSNSITVIESNSFGACFNLKRVKLPKKLIRIEREAFNSVGLKEIEIPNTCKYIEKAAFSGCADLKAAKLSRNLETLGEEAFEYCSSLTEVHFNGNRKLFKIMRNTFADCPKLKQIDLPDTVAKIGNQAFYHCAELTKIKIPKDCYCIGEQAFEKCIGLKEVEFNSALRIIGRWAFYSCISLDEIEIKEGCREIGTKAFRLCNLSSFSIPDTVIEIGESAFSGTDKESCIKMSNKMDSLSESQYNILF